MSIYLDYNATTPLRPEVWEAMARVEFGPDEMRNPSSVHRPGLAARRTMAQARVLIAEHVGARSDEIVFTGGGSEAINAALKGTVWASNRRGPHLISTAVEHPAVYRALDWLRGQGAEVTLLPVDGAGRVRPADVAGAIRPETILVSIQAVNNELGTIQPVAEVGALCRDRGVILHVDAVQALGKIPVNVAEWKCDLATVAAHKLGGPKGVGALFVRNGVTITPLVHGGRQERGQRSGTENVQGIVGFAEAVRLAGAEREDNWRRWTELREVLVGIAQDVDAVRVNSVARVTVPNCVNLTFMYCDGMALATNLSVRGVYISTGSACSSGDLEPSHVLKAIGLSDQAAHGSLRFSMGRPTTLEEVTEVRAILRDLVERLRLVTAPEDIGKCKDDCPCFVTG